MKHLLVISCVVSCVTALAACGESVVINGDEPTVGDCFQVSQERFDAAIKAGADGYSAELGLTGIKVEGLSNASLKIDTAAGLKETILVATKGAVARVTVKNKTTYLEAARKTNFVFKNLTYTCRANGKS